MPDAGKTRVRRNLLWAELMRRVFGIDVLVCPECQGDGRVIACIDDPAVIRKILEHLGRPSGGVELHPARGPVRSGESGGGASMDAASGERRAPDEPLAVTRPRLL